MIALCLGGAASVWDELKAAQALVGARPHIIVACNHAGIQYPGRIDAWATLHNERFNGWREERAARGGNTDYRAFIHARMRGVEAEVEPHGWYGSSGLYMAQVALNRLGAAGAILCGVPMDADQPHIHWPGRWQDTGRYRPGFEAAKADGANIRSMSGWTEEIFGRPSAAWIQGCAQAAGKPGRQSCV